MLAKKNSVPASRARVETARPKHKRDAAGDVTTRGRFKPTRDEAAIRRAVDALAPRDLGRCREGFDSIQRVLCAVPPDRKLEVFRVQCRDAAAFRYYGLDEATIGQTLTEIARAHALAARHGEKEIGEIIDAALAAGSR